MSLSRICTSLAGLALAGSASAAGMTTHAFMADFGRKSLPEGPLKQILTAHRTSMLAGALNPDGGYGSGAAFPEDRELAERSHWEDFLDSFVVHLRATGCTGQVVAALPETPQGTLDLNQITGRCGSLIAFMFGDAAHGLTDETWDSLFEPVVRERGEDPNPAAFLAAARGTLPAPVYDGLYNLFGATPLNAIEYAMDMVAIVEHNLWADAPTLQWPPVEDLVAVHRINRPNQGVTAEAILRSTAVARAAVQAERAGAANESVRIRQQMPWASANYFTAPGGVVHSGYMVARLYEHLWAKLIGAPLPIRVIGTHPANGAVNVPFKRNAAGLCIRAFTGQSHTKASAEAPGTLALFDHEGQRVAATPRSGIYDPEFGHVLDLSPNADLKPNTRYTVVVTRKLRDHLALSPPTPFSWSFTTAK